MTDIVKSRYHIETLPPHKGDTETIWNTLSFRVKDSYTGMPIGVVLHGTENGRGSFKVKMFLSPGRSDMEEGDWGARFDLAAEHVWKRYNETLPCKERLIRWCWRWIAVGWLLFGTVWGVAVSFVARSILG